LTDSSTQDSTTLKASAVEPSNDSLVLFSEEEDWACTACTLINPGPLDACEVCGAVKPALAKLIAASSSCSSSTSTSTSTSSSTGKKASTSRPRGEPKAKSPGSSSSKKISKRPIKDDSDEDYDDDSDCSNSGEADEAINEEDDDVYSEPEYESDSERLFLEEGEPEETESDKNMFKVVKKEELVKMQLKLIESMAAELGVSKWNAALLLQHFRWNVSKLQANYWDRQSKVLKEAGIKRKKKKKKKGSKGQMVECLICCDDVKPSKVFMLNCGHGPYCPACWQNHLNVIVKNSSAEGILNATCMWPRCPLKINRKAFKKLASPEDFGRYDYFFLKYYVDCTNKISWCPNPSCTNAIVCADDCGRPAAPVTCTCGRQFCFACGSENHNPVSCEQLTKWQQRNCDDQESIKLIMATTKPCFHCGIPTTRIDGCNHMTCRKEKGGCGGEWCWMCRGDWKSHGEHTGGFYSCNKYDTSQAKSLDDEAARLKQEADRYLHYFNRYFAHETAEKGIVALRQKALEKQAQFREMHASVNGDFFTEAVDLLQKCRHILKYTYVYGFNLPDNSTGKEFFEYLQANAEGITERLSDQVNAPLNKLDITSFKNIIRVTSKYIENLVKGMEDGLGVEGLGKEKPSFGRK
jgi:ariadne-1